MLGVGHRTAVVESGVRFAMHPAVVAGLGAVSAALLALAVVDDGPGRIMFGVAALLAAGESLRGALLRPTLAITDDGVLVARGFVDRELLPWSAIDDAALQRRSRRGASAKWLELDTGERLITVPGYRLGAPVRDVLAAIEAARPA